MDYITKNYIHRRVAEHYAEAERLGYEVFGCFAQGSMNYGDKLFDEESDVDTKCLIIPSFRDICLNRKAVSTTHEMENGELLDLKDIRLYLQLFKKQNINIIEILFTPYYKINPKYMNLVYELVLHREKIARYDIPRALNCMVGMIYEKQKGLCHPYPTIKEKIEKYGYDGKQLSHALRVLNLMLNYCRGQSYAECLVPTNGEYLRRVKRNLEFTADEAVEKMNETVKIAVDLRDSFLSAAGTEFTPNKKIETLLEEIQTEAIRIAIREEVI